MHSFTQPTRASWWLVCVVNLYFNEAVCELQDDDATCWRDVVQVLNVQLSAVLTCQKMEQCPV